ncbi:hypothetical protein [Clostridium sp.]|uniref:hypothetical protein n=1 Tax=Clostridium sp. TaxID=1506 RepID=UPI0032177518
MFGRFKDNKKMYITVVSVGIIVFLLSYTVSISFLKNSENKGLGLFGEARQTSSLNGGDVVISEDSKIKFVLNYKNCLDTVYINEKLDQPIKVEQDKLIGINEIEAEKIFSNFGYKLDRFTKEEVIFVKDIDGYNYKEDSYFIGVKDNYIAIYKKEADGSLKVIEAKISNPKDESGSYLQVKDIENRGNLLKTFYEGHEDYQFSNIQEAIEYAQALCST